MPIGRYFLFAGSLLVALLFLAEWHLRPSSLATPRSDIDRIAIRIHSSHKWPKALVFDTTQPTIVPPPPTPSVEEPTLAQAQAKEAYAMVEEPAAAAKPVRAAKSQTRRSRKIRASGHRFAGNDMFGSSPMLAPPRREALASRNDWFGSAGFWSVRR